PCLVGGIAVGFIFKFFFTHGFILDSILGAVGFDMDSLPSWLKDTRINNWVLVATSVWRYMGQNMVLFIGALASVDSTMYEAADIDGANAWHKFRYITFPSIKTIIILNLILAVSGSLSAFEMPYVITGGGFGTSTFFVLMNKLAHTNQKVGLASAMSVVLLTLILLVTALQKWAEKRMDGGSTKKRR
ncbi:MAG: sugar ABC transporter permease, partial [Ruminococcus sp.]|nr:sugar ABC transporter permease [Ruminococcus sp.]